MRRITYGRMAASALAACLPLWAGALPLAPEEQRDDQVAYYRAEQAALSAPCVADEEEADEEVEATPDAEVEPAAAEPEPPAADPQPLEPLGDAVALERLDASRGGSEIVNNDMALSGIVADNSATNVATGANTVGQASFANASGLPIVIQNSGANVLIQNATIINVQLK